jgi:2-polyprenyl-3-methyl-5-hydroxy-6-metoxy-1,4-benzoquinol methylase
MATENPLEDRISTVPFSEQGPRWDGCWKEALTPWDRGTASIALHDLLSQRHDLVPPSQHLDHRGHPLRDSTGAVQKKTALVPGCGRGHDVLLLSSWGYDVWGLDYSAAAKEEAIKNQKQAESEGLYKPIEGLDKGQIHWVTGDFFQQDWVKGAGVDGKFDLIYDYTVITHLFSPGSIYPGYLCSCSRPTNSIVFVRPASRSKTEMGQAHDRTTFS